MGFLGPLINTRIAVRNYSSSTFLYQLCIPFVSQFGMFHRPRRNIELSIISITVKANPVFPDDISQG